MEKRAILFVILSTMVMLVFYALQPQKATQSPAPAKKAEVPAATNAPTGQPASSGQPATQPVTQSTTAAPDAFVTVDTPLYKARFSSRGGTIASWVLKGYMDDNGKPLDLIRPGSAIRALAIGSGDDFSLSDNNFEIAGREIKLAEDSASQSLTFTYSSGASTIRRTMEFMPNTYSFKLRDEVSGMDAYQITLGESFGIYHPDDSYTHSGGVYLMESDREELKPGDLDTPQDFTGQIKWIANEDKYFCSAIVPKSPVQSIRAWKLSEDKMTISLIATGVSHEALIFAGPKEHDRLAALGNGLEYIVDFGFFSLIARPIFWLMKQIYAIVGNYGWAIVILTIIIRVPFIPLVNKGQKSMKEMQALQPRIKELKEKHKNNAEKMNQEMMELYRKHKVNPLGGCLPILVQIPVFFALYKVLLIAIELRGAPWMFWIKDLSIKDPYYVMPIIMGATMFIQQKLTPSASPDPMQQKIMTYLPVIFTFMFLTFPSGLVLYWLVNNLLSIAQQLYVNNKATPATK